MIAAAQKSFKTAWRANSAPGKLPYFRIYDLRSTYATRFEWREGWRTNGSRNFLAAGAMPKCSRNTHK